MKHYSFLVLALIVALFSSAVFNSCSSNPEKAEIMALEGPKECNVFLCEFSDFVKKTAKSYNPESASSSFKVAAKMEEFQEKYEKLEDQMSRAQKNKFELLGTELLLAMDKDDEDSQNISKEDLKKADDFLDDFEKFVKTTAKSYDKNNAMANLQISTQVLEYVEKFTDMEDNMTKAQQHRYQLLYSELLLSMGEDEE